MPHNSKWKQVIKAGERLTCPCGFLILAQTEQHLVLSLKLHKKKCKVCHENPNGLNDSFNRCFKEVKYQP